ncbi:MAG: glycosyltransferase [Nanoarchaeota archaeon]|nr:glycosyltransferase [Nanoarchaeota archaeon]MBU4086183.1 glycosyltransferase [Nanoarchaeota archaeon]
MRYYNFSIVIPAHNEERYIKNTLVNASSLDYPKDKFEILVVENGSIDRTYDVAKKFARKNIRIFKIQSRGVSRAKNFGAEKSRKKTEWIIFLDADVVVERNFLNELNAFLIENGRDLVIGTTGLVPLEPDFRHNAWFRFHDFLHRFFKLSLSVQIANKKVFRKVRYDENLRYSEDIKLIREMIKRGRFFYMPTKSVKISTRRFDKEGHFKLLLKWGYMNNLPYKSRIKRDYEVVR